jgi:two-component system clock-associated histidine kinase SasA
MQVIPNQATNTKLALQLLLFVDSRPHSAEQIQEIRNYLKQWRTEFPYNLEIINVVEEPYLAEHYKLIATPTLLKLYPEPRQVLTGNNIVAQLDKCWVRWQSTLKEHLNTQLLESNCVVKPHETPQSQKNSSVADSAEMIRLSDEVFRLKQEKAELLDQLRFKDQMIAMLAHDIRNPLTAVSLALETLTKTTTSADGKKTPIAPSLFNRLIKHARNQAKAIDRLIEDILQAAGGDQDQFYLHRQQLNLGCLCHEILEDFSHQFEKKSLNLLRDIPNDLPLVYADPERVRQVMINLLDNACKYSPEGGNIRLSILHRTTQKVQVSIADEGPGIPPENQENIFNNHFRLQRDHGQKGYGIGLSVCRQLIRSHYGQIWVDSALSKGSTFHFTLPVYQG